MKKVLKLILSVALLLAVAFVFTSCRDNDDAGTAGEADAGLRVALLTHSPETVLDDASFNEGSWNGIANFLTAQGLPLAVGEHRQFFSPHAADDAVRLDLIEQAIDWGADVLVLPGFQWENAVAEAQNMFEDANFIIIDGAPDPINSNVVSVFFAENEAGFLAGYAAVRDGFTELGFMGGHAIPPVVRFGHGFLLGAEHAANQMGLAPGSITINYHYLATFAPSPEVVTAAGAWFVAGTEVIFAAAGGAGGSVMAGAEANNGLVIGVDGDQSGQSDTVITSAMKTLDSSVYDFLTEIANGTFQGGRSVVYDASMGGVGLPIGTSRFSTFNQAMYDSLFADIAAGNVNVSGSLDMSEILAELTIVTVIEH